MKYLIMIGGPTASGKTSLSIALAQHYDCPILSADSRQFYQEISIGTAKPTKEELSQADHRFINSMSIQDDYSVGEYERQAIHTLSEIYADHDYAIMVGGSGLYLRAVAEGIDDFPDVPDAVRAEVQQQYDSSGIDPLQKELRDQDPDYAARVDLSNPHRLIRAIAVIRHTGQPFSTFLRDRSVERPFKTIQLRTDVDRDILYDRINDRVDQMMELGLLDEVKSVYPYRHLNSLNTVGYKELFAHLDGDCSLEYAVDKIKQHTRNYAKRQMTWFRNQGNWYPVDSKHPKMAVQAIDRLKAKIK